MTRTGLPTWLVEREDFKAAFAANFTVDECLAALKVSPEARNDAHMNLLLRWTGTIKFFSKLQARAREALCNTIRYTSVPANTVITRQGDRGSTMYVVIKGSVEVMVDGQRLNVLTNGTAFGEIALLSRSGTRSSTCVALVDTQMAVLTRDEYLAVVHMVHRRDTQERAEFLARIPMFVGVSEARLLKLASLTRARTFHKDDVICRRGDHCDRVFFILRGLCHEMRHWYKHGSNKWPAPGGPALDATVESMTATGAGGSWGVRTRPGTAQDSTTTAGMGKSHSEARLMQTSKTRLKLTAVIAELSHMNYFGGEAILHEAVGKRAVAMRTPSVVAALESPLTGARAPSSAEHTQGAGDSATWKPKLYEVAGSSKDRVRTEELAPAAPASAEMGLLRSESTWNVTKKSLAAVDAPHKAAPLSMAPSSRNLRGGSAGFQPMPTLSQTAPADMIANRVSWRRDFLRAGEGLGGGMAPAGRLVSAKRKGKHDRREKGGDGSNQWRWRDYGRSSLRKARARADKPSRRAAPSPVRTTGRAGTAPSRSRGAARADIRKRGKAVASSSPSALLGSLAPVKRINAERPLTIGAVFPSTIVCASKKVEVLQLHIEDLRQTIDAHTLKKLQQRIAADTNPTSDDQYQMLCKQKQEIEKVQAQLVNEIFSQKVVRYTQKGEVPARPHMRGPAGRVKRVVQKVLPKLDPSWLEETKLSQWTDLPKPFDADAFREEVRRGVEERKASGDTRMSPSTSSTDALLRSKRRRSEQSARSGSCPGSPSSVSGTPRWGVGSAFTPSRPGSGAASPVGASSRPSSRGSQPDYSDGGLSEPSAPLPPTPHGGMSARVATPPLAVVTESAEADQDGV